MSGHDGTEPVADDELLYRRIPVSKGWYTQKRLSPEAFDPRPGERTGISLYREKYKPIQEVARGKGRQGYYVAVLRAGDVRKHGIEVVPRPQLDDPGHAEMPDLTCDNRLTQEALERKLRLVELCVRVEGPFPPTTD